MKRVFVALLLVVIFSVAAEGHHGIANFNLNKDVAFTGIISDVAFINPHSWVYVDVLNADGVMVTWQCEMRSATVLRRSGWSRDMFELGTEISITGSPDRFKDNVCYMGSIILADGSSMNRYGQFAKTIPGRQENLAVADTRPARSIDGKPNITGDWAAEQRVMTDPQGISGAFLPLSVAQEMAPGEVPEGGFAFPGSRGTAASLSDKPIVTAWSRPSPVALTEAGKRAVEGFDGSSTDNPRLRCEATNILFDWTFDTHVNRIEQSDTEITLLYGFMDMERTIHLNQSDFPEELALTRSGYSIGHWQGDVLIVTTTGFLPGVLSADANTMHSEKMRVTERFTLDADKGALRREYSAVDPLFFAGEYRGGDILLLADLPYESYGCDDRSYRSDL